MVPVCTDVVLRIKLSKVHRLLTADTVEKGSDHHATLPTSTCLIYHSSSFYPTNCQPQVVQRLSQLQNVKQPAKALEELILQTSNVQAGYAAAASIPSSSHPMDRQHAHPAGKMAHRPCQLSASAWTAHCTLWQQL